MLDSLGFDLPPRFRVRRLLGSGGFGVVYEAWDEERSEAVAVKVLSRCTPDALYRFKREFRAAADLVHPNVVRLYELFGRDRRRGSASQPAVDAADRPCWRKPSPVPVRGAGSAPAALRSRVRRGLLERQDEDPRAR